MKRTDTLGAIHYDERLLSELWERLVIFSDDATVGFKVYHGSSISTFESLEELNNAIQIPDRVTRFDFMLDSSDGSIRILARDDEHKYVIQGEENWVRQIADYVEEFGEERHNRLRTILSNRNLSFLQLGFAAVLVGSFWEEIVALLIPMLHVPMSGVQSRIFLGLIAGILLLEISKYIYPSVVYRRRNSPSRIRQTAFVLSILGSVATALQAIYLVV